MELNIKGAMNYGRQHWHALLIGAIIGYLLASLGGPDPRSTVTTKCNCQAEQKQITNLKAQLKASASAKGGLHIGAGKPRPSTKADCPDCPGCPEIDLDWELMAGGNAGGSANVTNAGTLSATADAEVKPTKKGPALSLWIGGDMPVLPAIDVRAAALTGDLQLGPWMAGIGYRPGYHHELRIQARYQLLGK